MAKKTVVAIVLAAGQGRRIGAATNKAFLPIAGEPMLAWSLKLFEKAPEVEGVILVAAAVDLDESSRLIKAHALRKVLQVIPGGPTRQDSEWSGLSAAGEAMKSRGIVLVHDAARPFAAPDLLPRLIAEARAAGGAVPAVAAPPTIVETADGLVTGYPTRLWAVQTPQAFRLAELIAAHRRAKELGFQATDTAAVYERAGGTVRIVESSPDNIKITTPDDLSRAEMIAGRRLR